MLCKCALPFLFSRAELTISGRSKGKAVAVFSSSVHFPLVQSRASSNIGGQIGDLLHRDGPQHSQQSTCLFLPLLRRALSLLDKILYWSQLLSKPGNEARYSPGVSPEAKPFLNHECSMMYSSAA